MQRYELFRQYHPFYQKLTLTRLAYYGLCCTFAPDFLQFNFFFAISNEIFRQSCRITNRSETENECDLPGIRKECPCYDDGADQNGETPSQSLKTLPRIWDRPMHRVQKPDPNLGDIYAWGVETYLRFRGHLCTGCRMFSQKWIWKTTNYTRSAMQGDTFYFGWSFNT